MKLISPFLVFASLVVVRPCSAQVSYIDASPSNTTLADGTPYVPESYIAGPGDTQIDELWSVRTFGNGGTVYTANDFNAIPGEDAPTLRTSITGLNPGETYQVFVYYWVAGISTDDGTDTVAVGNQRWDLSAGFSTDELLEITWNAGIQINAHEDHPGFRGDVITHQDDRGLYEFGLGNKAADLNGEIQVFVDDLPGNANRSWYDGVGVLATSPFDSWISAFHLNDRTPSGNDDGDFHNNFVEFALDGDPSSSANSGKSFASIAVLEGANFLTYTLAVREGASIIEKTPGSGDFLIRGEGVSYRIQASSDLVEWGQLEVDELDQAEAAALQTALPTPSMGWIYRTFITPEIVAPTQKGFMRVVIEEAL